MKKEILVFIFNGYADWEPAYVCAELNSSDTDYIVRTISLDKNPKVSMGGFHVLPDYSIADYPANFSLLILAGGRRGQNKRIMKYYPLLNMRLVIIFQLGQSVMQSTLWLKMVS